jgi:hypothetical protein
MYSQKKKVFNTYVDVTNEIFIEFLYCYIPINNFYIRFVQLHGHSIWYTRKGITAESADFSIPFSSIRRGVL